LETSSDSSQFGRFDLNVGFSSESPLSCRGVQSQGISTSFQPGDPPFNAPDLQCIESIIGDFQMHGLVEEVHAPAGGMEQKIAGGKFFMRPEPES